MKPTKEDINRNLELMEMGKPLDMPLAVLNGEMKKQAITLPSKRAYKKTDKYKAYQKAYQKTDKYKAYQKAYYQKNKERILVRLEARR